MEKNRLEGRLRDGHTSRGYLCCFWRRTNLGGNALRPISRNRRQAPEEEKMLASNLLSGAVFLLLQAQYAQKIIDTLALQGKMCNHYSIGT